jgi:hypothetical protein
MRTVLLLLVCGAANAQVIECPATFPYEPAPLARDSKGIVAPSRLNGGGAYFGELGGRGELHGERKEVKGGTDVRYGFAEDDQKWFVCGYGSDGAIGSWRAVDAKAAACTMRQRTRGGVTTVRAECK